MTSQLVKMWLKRQARINMEKKYLKLNASDHLYYFPYSFLIIDLKKDF